LIPGAPPPLARSAFGLAPGLVYLNHAAVGVLPLATRDALRAMLDDHAARGVLGVGPREAELPAYRERVAELIGGRGDEIALLRSTGDGATILAQGLDLGPGDEVIVGANEFGANAYPWFALRGRGVVVTQLAPGERMTPDALRRALSPLTRLVVVSWVAFDDGYRHDVAALAEVAHAAGALFAVDAMQGLGVFPLDVTASGIDALYGGGAKWLLATQGIAFLWLRANLLDRVALRLPGWRSMADIWDYLAYDQPLAPDASRYEGGTPNVLGALALATSIGLLAEAGAERIAGHVLALTDRLVDGLRARGYDVLSDRSRDDVKSAIVRFRRDGADHAALGERLAQAGIVVTARQGAIRVSPHGYNTAAEIDALLEALPR
jgi:cysteine desulfurase / selenocysteine lyase